MNSTLRNRYVNDSVTTASPQSLLVRLYDRLVLDLTRAEQALDADDHAVAHENLVHAQAIITELLTTLQTEVWDGGPALAQVYEFCMSELVQANLTKDAIRTAVVRELLEPLRDAWRDAALTPASEPAPSISISA